MLNRKSIIRALIIFLVLTFSFFCSTPAGAQGKTVRLSIATGGTGGVYCVMGEGIAALVSKYLPQTEATAEVTAVSVDNLKLIITPPVPVIATGNFLVVHGKMDEKVAYGAVKTLFDHREDLIAVHKEAEKITLATAANESGIPFHPGAIRFYRGKNAWKGK